jgi:hypothetical protein
MSNDQAEAILLAERVLQRVGSEGPDAYRGGAWHDYVREAAAIATGDGLLCGLCDGLHILEDEPATHPDLDSFLREELGDDAALFIGS